MRLMWPRPVAGLGAEALVQVVPGSGRRRSAAGCRCGRQKARAACSRGEGVGVVGHGAGGVFPVAEELVAAGDENPVGLLAVTIGGRWRRRGRGTARPRCGRPGPRPSRRSCRESARGGPGRGGAGRWPVTALAGAGVPWSWRTSARLALVGQSRRLISSGSGRCPLFADRQLGEFVGEAAGEGPVCWCRSRPAAPTAGCRRPWPSAGHRPGDPRFCRGLSSGATRWST